MKLRVRVSFGQTINMGNFESVRPEFELSDDVQEGEDLHTAYLRVRADAENIFIKEINAQLFLFREQAKERKVNA